uniref:RING-type domain-containing protein n=1 Tax=Chenopodium quinoa TaxID=63459 RepID=A0A803LHG5_CHEQI
MFIKSCCDDFFRLHELSSIDAAVSVRAPQPACVSAPNIAHHQNNLEDVNSVVIDVEKLQEISENSADCVICFEGFDAEKEDDCGGFKVLEQCGHKFHGSCIDEWLTINLRDIHSYQMTVRRDSGKLRLCL